MIHWNIQAPLGGSKCDNKLVRRVWEYGGSGTHNSSHTVVVLLENQTRKEFTTTDGNIEAVRKEASDYADTIK